MHPHPLNYKKIKFRYFSNVLDTWTVETTKLHLSILFALFSLTLHAQKSIFNKVYLDGELGLMSFGGDGWFVAGATDISLGYRINPQLATGVSLIAWSEPSACCSTSASGAGIQLRYTPAHFRMMLKAETGYLLRASYSDDGPNLFVKNNTASNKYYFRASADCRLGWVTTGLTWATANGQKNDYFDDMNQFLYTGNFNVRAVSWHVGFAFPRYRKMGK